MDSHPAAGAPPGRARADLTALAERGRAGTMTPLGGLHTYDAATAVGYRAAAVLALFTPTAAGTEVFLVRRADHLRHHPGQIALPGGRVEPDDAGEVGAALRETQEETGLDPERVEVLGPLPPVLVPVSRYAVTPVLGWTEHPDVVSVVEPGEVLHTMRVPVGDLLDPAARATVRIAAPAGPVFRSAGFLTSGGWVWGFTGNLLDHLFAELGWTLPWDTSREVAFGYDAARGLAVPPADATW